MLHVAAGPELFDHTLWASATDERREELAQLVAAELGSEFFKYEGLRRYGRASAPVAVFVHATVGELSLVPGGGFDMGLSPEEEQTIRAARDRAEAAAEDFDQEFDLLLSEIGQMRPLHRVVVPPFLIAQRVLSVGRALRWLPNLRDPLYGHVSKAPAHLNPEQITAVLLGTGLRLPAEAELEYAARGGLHRRLLPWGDALPDDATIEAMLADEDGSTHNAFGLHGYGLYPELCADHWQDHYRGAPDDGAPRPGSGMHVVRGGAGDCYPWQGCGEWNLMLCAMRMTERAAEFGASIRLVYGLGEHEEFFKEEEVPEETGDTQRAGRKAAKKNRASEGAKNSSAEKVTTAKSADKRAAKKSSAKESNASRSFEKAAAKKATAKKADGTESFEKAAAKAGAKKAAKKADGTESFEKAGAKAGAKKAAKKADGTQSFEKAGAKKAAKKAGGTESFDKAGAKKAAKKADGTESFDKAGAKKAAAKKADGTGSFEKAAAKAGAKKAAKKADGTESFDKAAAKKAAKKAGGTESFDKAGAKKADGTQSFDKAAAKKAAAKKADGTQSFDKAAAKKRKKAGATESSERAAAKKAAAKRAVATKSSDKAATEKAAQSKSAAKKSAKKAAAKRSAAKKLG